MSELININIEVMGRTLAITTYANEKDTLLSSVELLNQKVSAIKQQGQTMDNDKILILATLNLIHDFMKLKDKNGLNLSSMENKLERAIQTCHNLLKQ